MSPFAIVYLSCSVGAFLILGRMAWHGVGPLFGPSERGDFTEALTVGLFLGVLCWPAVVFGFFIWYTGKGYERLRARNKRDYSALAGRVLFGKLKP
jgi:hypothetical protein